MTLLFGSDYHTPSSILGKTRNNWWPHVQWQHREKNDQSMKVKKEMLNFWSEFKDITDTYVYILYKHIQDHIDT